MSSNVSKLAVLCAVLGLGGCVTTTPDDGTVHQECECKCTYSTPDERIGVFTFPSDGPSCSFTAIDNYVPCKDAQGETHAGTRYYDCVFKGVAPPVP